MKLDTKADIIAGLQADILRLEGFKPAIGAAVDVGLGPLKECFPNGTFPLGAIHEFLCGHPEDTAATGGFIAGLLSSFTNASANLWISARRTLFPPALRSFGIQPDRFIFIDLRKEKDVMWVVEESLKCGALSAVVCEMNDMDFIESRRLQLAVEKSKVTGFVLRKHLGKSKTTACVSRWKITSLPSAEFDNLPGIGFPTWRVELMRMRNGKPGVWDFQWMKGRFHPVYKSVVDSPYAEKKAG